MSVLPSRMSVDAFALQHELDVGEGGVAVRDEVRRARERVLEHRRVHGAFADDRAFVAAAGFALNTASRHAFWIVVRREGSTAGIVRSTLWMFAWPSPGDSTVTAKCVPLTLLPGPETVAVSFGANGRLAQLATLKGEETFCAGALS